MTNTTIDEILKKHPSAKRDALIPLLQEVQETVGYLSRDAVIQIGKHLSLPASKIYGVATFYNQFRFQATGKFHVQVCRGTACHVKGSASVLEAVKRHLGLNPGQTARDGVSAWRSWRAWVRLAPVISVNGEFYAGMTPDSVKEILNTYRGKTSANVQANK